jgi:hypothetical protein
MYDIPTYDHSKPEIQEESGPTFFHHAAKFSLWAPPLAAFFCMGIEHAVKGEHGRWAVLLCLGTAGLVMFLFLASFVLAIIALCGMGKHGTDGILVRAVSGLIVVTLLSSIFVINFVHGFQTAFHAATQDRKAVAAVTETSHEIEAQQRKEFNRSHAITIESSQPRIEKLKTALDEAAETGTTDTALAAKATKAYLGKVQCLMMDYAAAEKKILAPPTLFDLSEVDHREQLQVKRKLVEDFLAANEKLMSFVMNSEAAYRDELTKFKVPAATAEGALRGFRGKAADRNFIGVKIRETDQKIGNAMLGMLDLLDTNWGDWKYDHQKKKPVFTDADAADKYDGHLREIQLAAADQLQLQRQLVNLPDVASNQQ